MKKSVHRVSRGPLNFRVVTDRADIPALIDLAREAHEESRFSYIPFSADKVVRIAKLALKDDKRHGIFIAERGAVPVGFACCTLGEYHIGANVLIATIHNINARLSIRGVLNGGCMAVGLFRGSENWAKSKGAHEILAHVTSGVNLAQSHSLLKRLGYAFVGGSYGKSIKVENLVR